MAIYGVVRREGYLDDLELFLCGVGENALELEVDGDVSVVLFGETG